MKKVIILKGLPASGKSTWAREQIDKNPGSYKRINKDDLRAMLDNSRWSRDNEKFILKARDLLIIEALENGKHVIVDDTNLASKHEDRIRQLVHGKAKVEIKFFDIDPNTCIERDLKREKSVGEQVIRNMWNQFLRKTETYEPRKNVPKAVIFDVDGTLAHMKDRSPFDWDKVGEDEPDELVIDILNNEKDAGNKIIIVTGRDGVCEQETKDWLKKHGVEYDDFYIRPKGNTENDAIIKERMFKLNIEPKYHVLRVYDDRDRVVEMWRNLGVKCLQVAEGNF